MRDPLFSPAKTFLIFVLVAFVLLSMFGLGHMSGMETNEDGIMERCLFTGGTALCTMGVVEHISLWQSTSIAVSQKDLTLLLLLILLVAVIFTTKNILAPPRLLRSEVSTNLLSAREHPHFSLSNPLKEAFSQGILNPKIYEPARR